jgi:endoglucanase
METCLSYIEALCAVPGVSGYENPVAETAAKFLAKHGKVRRDALGSVLCEVPGHPGAPLLLDAHMDQVGMAVVDVTGDGFVRLENVGGADVRVMGAQAVRIHGNRTVFGVVHVPAPHLGEQTNAPAWDAVFADTGLSGEQARDCIPLGSPVTFSQTPARLQGNRLAAPALDNRAGCAAILRALDFLKGVPHPALTVLFSAQEERGCVGAGTAAFGTAARTDAGFPRAIVLDVTFGRAPDVSKREGCALGCGPAVGVSPGLDAGISKEFARLAEKHNIPWQTEAMPGRTGTNADVLARVGAGMRVGLLSIPIRNMHTAAELADLVDIEATARLLSLYIKESGAAE